jgi:hypothetical protein
MALISFVLLLTRLHLFSEPTLRYVVDYMTTVESTAISSSAIRRGGGRYISLNLFPSHAVIRKVVQTD